VGVGDSGGGKEKFKVSCCGVIRFSVHRTVSCEEGWPPREQSKSLVSMRHY